MKRFYRNLIRWNLPSAERRHAEELANYVGHELAEQEITGGALESEIRESYYALKDLHEDSGITIEEWARWVQDGIKEYQSWIEEDAKMGTWERQGYRVVEVEFDHDLHEFEVVADNGEIIATITPSSLDDQNEIIKALDAGADVNSWEDGMGNTISITI